MQVTLLKYAHADLSACEPARKVQTGLIHYSAAQGGDDYAGRDLMETFEASRSPSKSSRGLAIPKHAFKLKPASQSAAKPTSPENVYLGAKESQK